METIRLIWDAEIGKHVPDTGKRRLPRRGQFIPPIPADWFKAAGLLPGKALLVAAIIRFEATKRHSSHVKFTGRMTESFGIGPTSRRRAIAALEAAGLIQIARQRRQGSSPMITILERD
jgi:hypothetical protein